jgi:hypothetical protein
MVNDTAKSTSRRKFCSAALSLFLLNAFTACEAKPMTVTLDVVWFMYIDRPTFEQFINGKGGDSSFGMPAVGGSTISGVTLPLGPQKITWRLDGPGGMARNGEQVTSKNIPELKDIPKSSRYLAIHIYPDDTAELLLSEHYPRPSQRGETEIEKWEKKHGK